MAISTIVSLVVNILFVLMLGIGFLIGFKRGVKRAGLRIGLFFVFLIIGAVVSPYITEAILGIKFTWPNGMRDTILKYFESLVRQSPDISNLFTYNASLSTALRQSIIVVCNFATFIIVALIMLLLSWIIYAILAKFVIRDVRKKKTLEEIRKNTTNTFDLAPKPEKKYRICGSLIGVFQAFVLAFVLFLPISGALATTQSIIDTASSSTTTTVVTTTLIDGENDGNTQKAELPATIGDFIVDNVPQELLDVISAYRKTAIGAISSIGGLDKLCFDSITTLNIRGQKITLRGELENVCDMYGKIVYLYEFDFENCELSELDFEIIDALVDELFSSNFVKAVSSDIVPYGLEKLVVQNDELKFGSYTGLIKGEGSYSGVGVSKFIEVLRKTDNPSYEIEQDIREIYEIAKLLISSGIADDVLEGNVDVTNILDTVTAPSDDGTILTQSINHLMKTNTLKIVLNMGFNAGLKALDENLSANIGICRYNEEVWGTAQTDAQNFAANLSSAYSYFNSLDQTTKDSIQKLSFNKEMFDALKEVDLDELILPIARALDNINSSVVFNQHPDGKQAENMPIIDRIIQSVYDSDFFEEFKKYIKLTSVNDQDFSFEQSIGDLIGVVEKLNEKDCLDLIFADTLDMKALFAKFDETKTSNALTFDQTFGVVIDSTLFRPTFVSVINLMNSKICDILGTNVVTDELSLDADIAAQKQDIKTFWDNFLPLSDQLLDEEGFELKDLDFDKLETLMEGLKTNVYQADGSIKDDAVFEAIYLNLIDYIKNDEDYGVYFTGYYISYDNPYEVDWHKLLVAVKIANDLKETGSISPSDFSTIAGIAGSSEAIEDAVKDTVKDMLSDEELKSKVEDLDLTDEETLKTIENVSKIADSLQGLGESQPTIGSDAKAFINGLNNQADQDTVDIIVGIVDELAKDEIVQNAEKISQSEKNEIEEAIDGAASLSDDTKNKLKGLFGIKTSETPEGSESGSGTTPEPTPEPKPETPEE